MLSNEPRRDHAIFADQASSWPAVLFNDCFQALRITPVRFLHAGMVAVVNRRILDRLGANTQVFFAHRQQFAMEIFVEHHLHSLFKAQSIGETRTTIMNDEVLLLVVIITPNIGTGGHACLAA